MMAVQKYRWIPIAAAVARCYDQRNNSTAAEISAREQIADWFSDGRLKLLVRELITTSQVSTAIPDRRSSRNELLSEGWPLRESFSNGNMRWTSGEMIIDRPNGVDIRFALYGICVDADGLDRCLALLNTGELRPSPQSPEPHNAYLSPFMKMMLAAINKFGITETPDRTLKKEVLVAHFLEQRLPDGSKVSDNLAKAMATLIRPPEAMQGGQKRAG